MRKYLDAVEANADSKSDPITWKGGKGTLAVESTDLGGGTVKLLARVHNPEWLEVGATTNLAAAGFAPFELPPGAILAVEFVGSTDPDPTTVSVAGSQLD